MTSVHPEFRPTCRELCDRRAEGLTQCRKPYSVNTRELRMSTGQTYFIMVSCRVHTKGQQTRNFRQCFSKGFSYKSKVLSRGVFRYHISALRRFSIVKQDTSVNRDMAISDLKPADGSQYLSSVAGISPYFPRTHRHIRWRRRMEELAWGVWLGAWNMEITPDSGHACRRVSKSWNVSCPHP